MQKLLLLTGTTVGTGGSTGTIAALFGSQSTNYNQQSFPLIRPEEFATLEKPTLYAYKLGGARVDKAYWFNVSRMKSLVERGG